MRNKISAVALAAFAVLGMAQAQTYNYSTLYSFQNNAKDPKWPTSLILDPAGNLFGGSYAGGKYSQGTIFELTPQRVLTVLHNFNYSAAIPTNLTRDSKGNLYGSTTYLARTSASILFKLTPQNSGTAYSFKTVYVSTDYIEDITNDPAGNLFGFFCGQGNGGPLCSSSSLFGIPMGGSYTTLWNFNPVIVSPGSNLVADKAGNIYGTDLGDGGQTSCGSVYRWSQQAGFSVLYAFTGPEGCGPSDLARDTAGNLYGVTYTGGANNNGTAFKIAATSGFSTLYNFCSLPNCADGSAPFSVTLDVAGNLYGTMNNLVFKLTQGGTESVIYNSGTAVLSNALAVDKNGVLYGITRDGGPAQAGTIFKLTPTN